MSLLTKSVDELRIIDPDTTWKQMSEDLGYKSAESLRSRYRRDKKSGKQDEAIEEDSNAIHFLDKKVKESVNWREYIDQASSNQELSERIDDTQRFANVRIETSKPIGIVFTGDWHLGDGHTDHALWKKDMQMVLDNPGIYLVDLGDDRQNMRSFKVLSSVLGQVLSPKMQALTIRSLIDELTDKNKILAKVDGNHDVEFDQRIFGEAVQSYLVENLKAPRFPGKGLMRITVGRIEYTMVLFHKSRFSSIFRPSHGAFREFQFTYPADIIAGGHNHIPAFELLPSYMAGPEAGLPVGGYTYLIKVGTYQDSEYGWKYFHNGGPMNIVMVLFPNEKKIIPFLSIDDALRFLKTFDTIS
jgi:hypothetical protein